MSAATAGTPEALTPVWGAVTHEVQGVLPTPLPLLVLFLPKEYLAFCNSSKGQTHGVEQSDCGSVGIFSIIRHRHIYIQLQVTSHHQGLQVWEAKYDTKVILADVVSSTVLLKGKRGHSILSNTD